MSIFNDKDYIDITGVNLLQFIKEVYNLSNPQGLGYLHYQENDILTDDEAKAHLLDVPLYSTFEVVVQMDYVKGRACKMTAWRDKETKKIYIRRKWFDHSDSQLRALLKRFNRKITNN